MPHYSFLELVKKKFPKVFSVKILPPEQSKGISLPCHVKPRLEAE